MNNKNRELSEEMLGAVSGGIRGEDYKGYRILKEGDSMTLVAKQYCSSCERKAYVSLIENINSFVMICTRCGKKVGELPFR